MKPFLLVLILASGLILHHVLAQSCQRRVCIFDVSQMFNRLDPKAVMKPEDIDPFLCTHIVYGFALLKDNTIVLGHPEDEANYKKITGLKKVNPNLKVLLSVGGWSQNSKEISKLIETRQTIQNFTKNTVKYLIDRNFDGLDVSWHFDGLFFITNSQLASMFGFLRLGFIMHQGYKKKLLLTATKYVPKPEDSVSEYDKAIRLGYIDWVNMLFQDLYRFPPQVTAHHSRLHTGDHDTDAGKLLSMSHIANEWVKKKILKHSMVLGVPFFGRAQILTTSNNERGAEAKLEPGIGKYVKQIDGYRTYFEICEMIKEGANVTFMKDQGVPYLYYKNLWVSYDDEKSVTEKVKFIKKNGFGGFLVYPINDDDFNGEFCGNGKFPLLTAMKNECNGSEV